MENSQPTDGGELLESVSRFIRRFVSLSAAQANLITLWVVHTHAIDAAQATPYLSVTSAEKQSGKTRLLEVLSLLVAKPWLTGSVSKAALVRKLDKEKPTLLLDESDAAFARDRDYSEALRAVLNSGHSRDGVASLCVGATANIEPRDFHVFGPKAIAGIGRLPDTVADRSIPIRMKRKTGDEEVQRFRRRLVQPEAEKLRERIVSWVARIIPCLENARPALPDPLSDRQQDGCEPLLAIADLCPNDWSELARRALIEILTGLAAEDNSFGVRLLSDIRKILDANSFDSIPTSDLLSALCDANPAWQEYSHGKPLSANGLARLLKPYGIEHRKLRVGQATPWGYQRSAFEDAWARYLRSNLEQVEQSSNDGAGRQFRDVEQSVNVPSLYEEGKPAVMRVVPDVPDSSPHRAVGSDYLFDAAVEICKQRGSVSVSEIANALGVNRTTAVGYVDEMERQGLVPPAHGAGPRPFRAPSAAEIGFGHSS